MYLISRLLSNGENIMWVARQLGHVNTEMVIKTYGKWIPDISILSGYKPVNDWSKHIESNRAKELNDPVVIPWEQKDEFFSEETLINQQLSMASPRGFEYQNKDFSDSSKPMKGKINQRLSRQNSYH